jgi:hypothetical protein
LGKAIELNANVGIAAGVSALGTKAVLESKKARAFPLRLVDGAVSFGALGSRGRSAAILKSSFVVLANNPA